MGVPTRGLAPRRPRTQARVSAAPAPSARAHPPDPRAPPRPRPGPAGPRLRASARGAARVRLEERARPRHLAEAGRPPASAKRGNRAFREGDVGASPAGVPAGRVPGAPPHPAAAARRPQALHVLGAAPGAPTAPASSPPPARGARAQAAPGRLARPRRGPQDRQARQPRADRPRPPSASATPRPPRPPPLTMMATASVPSEGSGAKQGLASGTALELLLGLLVPAARPDWAQGATAHPEQKVRRVARAEAPGGLSVASGRRWLLRKVRGPVVEAPQPMGDTLAPRRQGEGEAGWELVGTLRRLGVRRRGA